MKQEVRPGREIDTLTPDELRAILREQEGHGIAGLFDVCVGDFGTPNPILLISPPMRRLRVTRKPRGAESLAVSNVGDPVQMLDNDEGRLGGQIVNTGVNAAYIYPAPAADLKGSEHVGAPAVWISPNGGSWDFRIGGYVWGGSVCALAIAGATTFSVVEL